MYNNKCIFCNQGVKLTPENRRMIGTRYSYNSSAQHKDYKIPKYGGGFSKLLSVCKTDKEFHQLMPQTSRDSSRPLSQVPKNSRERQTRLAPVLTPNKLN